VPTPTPPSDNFGDPAQSEQNFNRGTLTQNAAAFDPAVSVVVQNGQLEITPRTSADNASFNGFVSVRPLDLDVTPNVSVEIKQTTEGEGAQTAFAVGTDSANFYRFVVDSDESVPPTPQSAGNSSKKTNLVDEAQPRQTGGRRLTFVTVINGQPFTVGIAYDPVQHRFWRFRSDAVARKMNFETSPEAIEWTLRFSSDISPLGVGALASELSAGTLRSTPNPGKAIFDNYAVAESARVRFSAANLEVNEASGRAVVTIIRSGNAESPGAVNFAAPKAQRRRA
jgi:hypothetical protein